MLAQIYIPAKNAMQSGKAGTKKWVLEYDAEAARSIDPLMGWTGSGDMKQQLKLRFATKEDAIAYAERNHIPYQVNAPKTPKPIAKAYADNFKYGRATTWTH